MTNRSSASSDDRKKNHPFLLKPVGKDYLWGGNRLNTEFGKGIDMSPLAETWECSTHPDGICRVTGGEFDKQLLSSVLEAHPEYLGTHPKSGTELPVLIKFIDAMKDLSIQVHPDDAYASEHEDGQLGKTEMWYVLDAEKDAKLVYGLRYDVDKESLRISIKEGSIEKYLQFISVKKNDVFFIPAGTIHAIGAGCLVAEIQENSNLTYRMYDYGRIDKNGKQRELHIDKALDVTDFRSSAEPKQPMRVLKYRRGCAEELLSRCKYFEVYRMLVNTERARTLVKFESDSSSFRVLLCIDGCGSIKYDGNIMDVYKGSTVFVPAESAEMRLHGQMQLLDVRC
jgi:mannose-6-phosphate isomerase class I